MSLHASDVMQRSLIQVAPSMTLVDLADLLIRERITGAPVVNEDGAVVGLVSRSDLVRLPLVERTLADLVADREEETAEALAGDLAAALPQSVVAGLAGKTVRDAMITNPLSVTPDTPLREVARLLVSRHFHRALVCDGERLVGLISSLDIVRLVADGRLVPG